MQKTIVTVIITALIIGGGVYFWQQQKMDEAKESFRFGTIDKYVDVVLNPSTNSAYKANKPSGFERATLGGQGEGVNVAPDGVSASVFVVAKSNWAVGSLEDVDTFYLEVVGPTPCWTEPNCNEPNTIDFYGPFQGELKLLVQ